MCKVYSASTCLYIVLHINNIFYVDLHDLPDTEYKCSLKKILYIKVRAGKLVNEILFQNLRGYLLLRIAK